MALRFRFSLKSLILTISVVVLILSHALSSYRLYWTQREFNQWRQGIGGLLSEQATEAQVVSVSTGRLDHWMWRVRVPPGQKYDLVVEFEDLISTEWAPSTRRIEKLPFGPDDVDRILGPGETVVTFIWGRQLQGLGATINANGSDRYLNAYLITMRPNSAAAYSYSEETDRIPWMQEDWILDYAITGDKTTVAVAPGSESSLLEVRAYPFKDLPNVDPKAAPKFTLKLVPAP